MRWKTRVVDLGCKILSNSSEERWPRSWRAALTVLKKTPSENRNGKPARRLTSNGCGASHTRLYWFRWRTNCTTHAQLLRITKKLDQKYGIGSREGASSNFGISRNSSKFTKR